MKRKKTQTLSNSQTLSKKFCPRDNCLHEATIDPTFGVLPCMSCQKKDEETELKRAPEFYTLSKQDRIQRDRDKSGKDWIQPWIGSKPNKRFIEAYPELRKQYFTKTQMKDAIEVNGL